MMPALGAGGRWFESGRPHTSFCAACMLWTGTATANLLWLDQAASECEVPLLPLETPLPWERLIALELNSTAVRNAKTPAVMA